MGNEQAKIEQAGVREAQEMPLTQESQETFMQEALIKSEEAVVSFESEGAQSMASLEQRAVEDGLEIDAVNKDELAALNQEAKVEVERLRKNLQPGFIKEFSGKRRSELAKEIIGKRKNRRIEQEKKREELESLSELKQELEKLSSTAVGSFLNYFKRKKLKTEIAQKENSQEIVGFFDEHNLDRTAFNSKMEKDIAIFCDAEKRRWESSPYNKDDIIKLFSEEHLSALSLEDYALLLKRFPGEMVTHVTRQGVRDHTGQMWHTAGTGMYHEGFNELISDGKLRSHWGRHFEQYEKKKAITEALKKIGLGEKWKTKEDALRSLDELTDTSGRIRYLESYSDYNAIHVAAEEVADEFYGAERGNEIFFAFSSNQIASQYYFNGRLDKKDFSVPNDQWIWTNEDNGIDLNSGIVFIPRDAEVDPVTGSKYEIGENGEAIEDGEQRQVVGDFIMSDDFDDFIKKASESLTDSSDVESRAKTKSLIEELEEKYNIKSRQLRENILNSSFIQKAVKNLGSKQNIIIEEKWLFYKKAKKTISSQEFWENKFKNQPNKKPSKIVYYEGGNPTEALARWKEQNGLTKSQWKEDMGFPEKNKDKLSTEANQGIERFRSLAKEAIGDYFAKDEDVI
ncbi:MAG: hypothetical protein WA064_01330 [Candidatus Moraniibacteriota bacterium]